MMRKISLFGLSVLMVIGFVTSTQAEKLDGKALYVSKACMSCHGAEGKAPIAPNYPKLAGQNKQYLIDQVTYINNGTRAGGLTMVMKGISSMLKKAETEAIADYLSKVK